MSTFTRSLILSVLVLFSSVALATAQGVTSNCKLSWVAPTTDTTGAILTPGVITGYRVYVDKPTIVPNVTPPTMNITTAVITPVQICTTLAAGSHTVAVSAVAGPLEGPASAQLPFVLVTATPASPSGLQVLP